MLKLVRHGKDLQNAYTCIPVWVNNSVGMTLDL